MTRFRYLPGIILALCLATPAFAAERFAFHSDPWMNLHHLLYHQARAERLGALMLRGRLPLREADQAMKLDAEERAVWNAALDAYAGVGEKDLLFDASMENLKETIAQGEPAIRAAAEREPVLQALLEAMPVYRTHLWPQHDALNRQLIARLREQLARHGEAIATTLAQRYESEWPASAIRVDASVYANRQGAYTSNTPNHIVMASADARHQDLMGLEILFHEAGHTVPLGDGMYETALAEANGAGVDEDRLWHSYIFHASGDAVKDVAGADYVTYADANGLWQRGPLSRHKSWLDACFGKGSLAEQFGCMYTKP